MSLSIFFSFFIQIYEMSQDTNSPKSQTKLMADLSHFLVNLVLPFDSYCNGLKKSQWTDLISIYTQISLDYFTPEAPTLIDLNLSLKCLRRLLAASVRHTTLSSTALGPRLFAFFNLVLVSVKYE